MVTASQPHSFKDLRPTCKSLKHVATAPIQTLGNRCDCHGSSEMTTIRCYIDGPCHSRCGKLKIPHCSKAMSVEHRSKLTVLNRQWWCLQMSEKFSSRKKNPTQTNKVFLFDALRIVNDFADELFFILYRHFEKLRSNLSRSPRQPSMEWRVRRLDNFELISNGRHHIWMSMEI